MTYATMIDKDEANLLINEDPVEMVSEQKIRTSELRYRRLFEAAQDEILILDAVTGAVTNVNPFLINLLGYSRGEFVEKKLWEVGAFKDIEASQEAFEALQQIEYIRYEDLPLRAKSGRLIDVKFLSNILSKLGVASRTEAVTLALRNRIVS